MTSISNNVSIYQKTVRKVSFITITVNILLSVLKLLAGIIAHSSAMISDAVHSASDVFSTVIVLIGVRLASKEADKEHPYGHERLECVAAVILAIFLFLTGLAIGIKAVSTLLTGNYLSDEEPGKLALIAAGVSICVKEGMFWYTRHFAKRIDSSALMADAWHHRSDSFSSIGALIGIAGARMGYLFMDAAASLLIFLFIAKASYDIFKDAFDKMVDHSCGEEMEQEIYDCVMNNEEVLGIDLLRTRVFGNAIYVDIEIRVNKDHTLYEAHNIAECVHDSVEEGFPKVKHVMVHVNPDEEDI